MHKFDDITVKDLAEFVRGIRDKETAPYYKSAELPKDNDGPVKEIVGNTYSRLVERSKEEFLVMMYNPSCGHCKHLAPRF